MDTGHSCVFKSFNVTFFDRQTKLTSILTLRNRVETKCNDKLRRIISESRFIGCVRYLLDVNRQLFLLQFESSLYLCDIQNLR